MKTKVGSVYRTDPNHRNDGRGNGDHTAVNHFDAKQRLAHCGHQDVRNDTYGRNDGDVNLGMSEEPEKMLPQQRRAAGMRLQMVADHQTGRNEKASARNAIKNQQHASWKQNRKSQ